MGSVLDAFGVTVTVTRPFPDQAPIVTRGAWIAAFDDGPGGSLQQRGGRRRVLVLDRTAVPAVPRHTTIDAAEAGGTVKRWRVDSVELEDAEHLRVRLLEEAQP